MNLHLRKITNYLLVFLLLIGVAIFVYFFIPALRMLNSEKLSVTQLHEKLTEQRQAIEGFQHPTEEEKRSWNDSKQRLKATYQLSADTPLLNEELVKQAEYSGISNIITSQASGGEKLKLSFLADYESLGRFLQWFDEHPHLVSILSLNVKRGLPLLSVEMEIEAHQLSCDF